MSLILTFLLPEHNFDSNELKMSNDTLASHTSYRPCKEPSSGDKFIAEQMLSRPWCPDPCVTSDPQHMVGQRSFDKLAASRCRRVTPLSWKSLWRAASSEQQATGDGVTPRPRLPDPRCRCSVASLEFPSTVP